MAANPEAVRRARQDSGLTQAALAEVAGMTVWRYRRIETGQSTASADEVQRIADAVGRPITDLRLTADEQAARERKTASRRTSAGRIGAHTSWANTKDWTSRTAGARRGFMARFEHQVDPSGELPDHIRAQRANAAMKAYMGQLAKRRQRTQQKEARSRKAARAAR